MEGFDVVDVLDRSSDEDVAIVVVATAAVVAVTTVVAAAVDIAYIVEIGSIHVLDL